MEIQTKDKNQISIVVPTFNSAPYLKDLHNSITNSPLAQSTQEVIYVCEGNNDNTLEILSELSKTSSIPIQIFVPKERLGKFLSRYEGAKRAKSERVLLIDSRVKLTNTTAQAIQDMPLEYRIVSGHVDIDENKNIFCLYWIRTHSRIFHRNFSEQETTIHITPEVFDNYVTGTTILFVDRDLFVKSCEHLKAAPMFSDDTYLLKEMCAITPLIIHPKVRIEWEPRRETWKFLKHLYDRGPGFAEYHVFERRGWLFYLVLIGFIGLLSVFLLMPFQPMISASVLLVGLLALVGSTAIFSKNLYEFLKLAPLHTMSLIFYGLGAINGVRVILQSRNQK